MEYSHITKAFWKGAKDVFDESVIRFFSGYRNTGQQILSNVKPGVHNPLNAKMIFALPSETVLNKFHPYEDKLPQRLQPGILEDAIKEAVKSTPPGTAMCLK